MKIEIGSPIPGWFVSYRRGRYGIASSPESACGIPGAPYALVTAGADGKQDVGFSGSGCFTECGGRLYAVVPVSKNAPAYKNVRRTREFTVNFIDGEYHPDAGTGLPDAGALHREPSGLVACPRLREAYLSLECRLEAQTSLPGGSTALLIGRVAHIAACEEYGHIG